MASTSTKKSTTISSFCSYQQLSSEEAEYIFKSLDWDYYEYKESPRNDLRCWLDTVGVGDTFDERIILEVKVIPDKGIHLTLED